MNNRAVFLSILPLFLLAEVCAFPQVDDIKAIFEKADQSISGVSITGTMTTFTPKEYYNKKAVMYRERTKKRQDRQKDRTNGLLRRMVSNHLNKTMNDPSEIANFDFQKFGNFMSVGRNHRDPEEVFPLAEEDVTRVWDFQVIYANGKTLVTIDREPDSAGKGKYMRYKEITLRESNRDVSITIPKYEKTDDPKLKPYTIPRKEVREKEKPTNLFLSFSAHKFGRGLSFLPVKKMVKSKRSHAEEGDLYTVFMGTGSMYYTPQQGEMLVDASKGYCWTEGYFYLQNELDTEFHASKFKRQGGIWFPYRVETVSYLPKDEQSEANKIRSQSVLEIDRIETGLQIELNEDNMIEEEIDVIESHESVNGSGLKTVHSTIKIIDSDQKE